MRNKPVRFGYKFWVAATPLCYAIQFYPYTDSSLGLGGSVVANLTEKLPLQVGFNYHIIMASLFTSPNLLRILQAKGIATEMLLGHRSKKWWWPVLRFCLDLSVNNAYQLYHQQKRSEGERKLDLLGFRRSIVDTYYRYLRKSTTTNIFPPSRKLSKVSHENRHDAINHWIGKEKQRRSASCQKTTLNICEKCDVGLHPNSHKQFHIKK